MLRFAVLLAALVASPAGAQSNRPPSLDWRSPDGVLQAAASLSLDVETEVAGLVAETRVRQRFVNEGSVPLEGIYRLPLPEGAAVHGLVVVIGDRRIEGEIRERVQARAEYQLAAANGQRSSLVERDDRNVFRTAVANVMPGESVAVEVRYWHRVVYRDGRFELVFPLGIVPRYAQRPAEGASSNPGETSTDAAALVGGAPPVSFDLRLTPGLALRAIESDSHPIDVRREGAAFRVRLASTSVPPDRDLVLRWRPEPAAAPRGALFVEAQGGVRYALAMLVPPDAVPQPLPRELTLVIDTSGSMHGVALEQAKAALDGALARLDARDRFNVIEFNSVTRALHEAPVPATPDAVAQARAFVAALVDSGGTEMAPALEQALAATPTPGYVRQVVFATDGAVTEEQQLYALIEARLGSARLFPVGIGDAPNAGFLERAARFGRGSHVIVRSLAEVDARLSELFAKLDRPAMRDVTVHWPQGAQAYPEQVPDLYAGEPLMLVARLEGPMLDLAAQGMLGDGAWKSALPVAQAVTVSGIARLWAQARIDALEDAQVRGADAETTRKAIVETALAHRLVSAHTSLVAVERKPVASADDPLASVEFANGGGDAVALAQGGLGSDLAALLGFLGLLVAGVARAPRPRRHRAEVAR